MRPLLPLPTLPPGLTGARDCLLAELTAAALNHFMRGQELPSRLTALDGKHLSLAVTDLGLTPVWSVADTRLAAAAPGVEPDVVIRGSARSFLRLAIRAEDPDTLFFNRELCLEGETESGLYLKNLLDAVELDPDAHLEDILGPCAGRALADLLRRAHLDRPARYLGNRLRATLSD